MTTKKQIEIALGAVKSSQIESIGHHPETNTLAIKFKGWGDKPGSVYHYQNFTAQQFDEFKKAKSIGSHFKTNIKTFTEKHPFVKQP